MSQDSHPRGAVPIAVAGVAGVRVQTRQGAGSPRPDQPASTGSSAASLTSVSANSARGSESRTTPTPA